MLAFVGIIADCCGSLRLTLAYQDINIQLCLRGIIFFKCTKILSQRHPFLSFFHGLFYHVKTHLWMIMMEYKIIMVKK